MILFFYTWYTVIIWKIVFFLWHASEFSVWFLRWTFCFFVFTRGYYSCSLTSLCEPLRQFTCTSSLSKDPWLFCCSPKTCSLRSATKVFSEKIKDFYKVFISCLSHNNNFMNVREFLSCSVMNCNFW